MTVETYTCPSVCLLCHQIYEYKPGYKDPRAVSHGICPECYALPDLQGRLDAEVDRRRAEMAA